MGKLDPDDIQNLTKSITAFIGPLIEERVKAEVTNEIAYQVKKEVYQMSAHVIKQIIKEYLQNNITVDVIVRGKDAL